jgi:gluconokinase
MLRRASIGVSFKTMKVPGLRSPHDKVQGIVYFGRMLDKIRLQAKQQLPQEYHANLGGGFDDFCCRFLWIEYPALTARTKEGGTDDEIIAWAFQQGRQPNDHEVMVWNEFMRKRGWNDEASERLAMRKGESGISARDDIQTFFDYIDCDEEL